MSDETKMATDEQVEALMAAGISEADAGSYSAAEAKAKLADLAKPEPSACRCGCGGMSRGLFVPGHDARHKSALAKRLFEALLGDTADADVAAAVRTEADEIDVAYGREPGKWRQLIDKQVENLRKNMAAVAKREAKGTPVQRAKRAHAKALRTSTDESDSAPGPLSPETVKAARDDYIEDLMDRLQRHPRVGQLGWLRLPDQERQVARVHVTHRGEDNFATMEVKIVETGEVITVQCEQWLADPDLERVGT